MWSTIRWRSQNKELRTIALKTQLLVQIMVLLEMSRNICKWNLFIIPPAWCSLQNKQYRNTTTVLCLQLGFPRKTRCYRVCLCVCVCVVKFWQLTRVSSLKEVCSRKQGNNSSGQTHTHPSKIQNACVNMISDKQKPKHSVGRASQQRKAKYSACPYLICTCATCILFYSSNF